MNVALSCAERSVVLGLRRLPLEALLAANTTCSPGHGSQALGSDVLFVRDTESKPSRANAARRDSHFLIADDWIAKGRWLDPVQFVRPGGDRKTSTVPVSIAQLSLAVFQDPLEHIDFSTYHHCRRHSSGHH
jgi:hypothetical protein